MLRYNDDDTARLLAPTNYCANYEWHIIQQPGYVGVTFVVVVGDNYKIDLIDQMCIFFAKPQEITDHF